MLERGNIIEFFAYCTTLETEARYKITKGKENKILT